MWRYFLPTRIFSGSGVLKSNQTVFKENGTKALVVTGRSSARLSGALDDAIEILKNLDVPYALFDEVEENPSFATVEKGGKIMEENDCDFVVAIGGGSPLDAAKAISALNKNREITCDDLYRGDSLVAFPIIAIPTTSGTGSEVTPYSILTDGNGIKKGFGMPSAFPIVSFLDAGYTLTMSREVTLATALDALSHSLEGEIVNNGYNPLVKMLSVESTGIIYRVLPRLIDRERDFALREKMQYAAMLAGMVIAHTGTTAVHAAGYPLSSFKGVKHGIANAVTMIKVFERIAQADPERIARAIEPFKDLGELEDFLDSFRVQEMAPILTEEEVQRWSELSSKASHNKKTPGDLDRDFYVELYRGLGKR
ncbi:MAG: iron-containing alcohol dehydrogenase [Mesotoga sp.]|jgi:alcohol dehydrogenase|nr:iron-containing alcohol dehydrogenase [Mesotoga sp.]MDD4478693.1 iron-containing alcohol dehydrogenase family protein [Mesotoga sp.]